MRAASPPRPAPALLPAAIRPLTLLALAACPQDQPLDPLDPAVLADIAEAGGDAEGGALSGRYAVVAAPATCDCPARAGIDPCGPEFAVLLGLTGAVDVTQVDGYLTWMPVAGDIALGMSGAVDHDGAFALAALYDLGSLLSTGDLHARMDGAFAADRSLAGDVDLRLRGELPDGPLDCRLGFTVTGAPAPAS